MARTLYLPDGSTEIAFAPEETLQQLIYAHLGQDCAALFAELLAEARNPWQNGDDFEQIADEYLSMLHSTMDEISGVLQEFNNPRLDRKKVHDALQNIYDALYRNL